MKRGGMIAALLAAVLATSAAVTVAAQDRLRHGPGGVGGHMMGGPGAFGLPGLHEVELTDVQKEQINAIGESHHEELRHMAEKTRAAHMALDQAALGDTVNEAEIRAKSADLAAAIADATILRATINAEILNVLTAEQQAKIKELRSQAKERRRR